MICNVAGPALTSKVLEILNAVKLVDEMQVLSD
jgi:hypothetical protein